MDTQRLLDNTGKVDLPDPFRFEDGSRVTSRADWARRRTEMRESLLRIQYGRAPETPGTVVPLAVTSGEEGRSGRASPREVTLGLGPQRRLSLRVQVFLPLGREQAPCPTILRVGLGCPAVDEVNQRGYALVCFDFRELASDAEGQASVGPTYRVYPDSDWGAIAVWAWGASRVMDYLQTCDWVDPRRVVITGHSRAGKAALLAGALDERFAVTVPNGSGCGGASCYRLVSPGGETLELITRPSRFAGWFHKDFRRFAGREAGLPFDQHFLRALIAPRSVLSTEALEDLWANPRGAWTAWVAAQPVFDFLDASDNNGIHFRPGGHDQLAEDIRALLDFSDWKFTGGAPPRDFAPLAEHNDRGQ